jgi:hypothetical protein
MPAGCPRYRVEDKLQVSGGADSHHFVPSVASPGRPSPGPPQSVTAGLGLEVSKRVSPRHLALSSCPVWLSNRAKTGHWVVRFLINWIVREDIQG